MWDEPVRKDLMLRALVRVAEKDVQACDPNEILRAVLQREEQGSMFFDKRVAFPHARIEGISTPIVALGLTRLGEFDVSTRKPIELLFPNPISGRHACGASSGFGSREPSGQKPAVDEKFGCSEQSRRSV